MGLGVSSLDHHCWDARVVQLVKHLTLDFSSDHDLMVCEIESHIMLCNDSMDPA